MNHSNVDIETGGFFSNLLQTYVPRKQCMYYEGDLILLHGFSDFLIALSYFSIPLGLVYFARRRPDLSFNGMFFLFAAFIILCGITHLFGLIAIWETYYRLDGLFKLATGIVSAMTAYIIWRLMPSALALPSAEELKERKEELHILVEKRTKELQETKSKYEAVVNNTVDGIITLSKEGIIQSYNKACEGIFGYKAEEIIGANVSRLMPEPYRSEHDDYLRRHHETGIANMVGSGREVKGQRKDGTVFPIDLSVSKVETEEEVFYSGIVRDITERMEAEKAQQHLSAIVQSTDDAIISKNLDSIILSWNPGAEKLFGYTAEEAVGKPITLIFPPELKYQEKDINRRLRNKEKIDHFETKRVTKNGDILDISVTISPIIDASGNVIGAAKVAHDITQRKKMEAQIRENAEILRKQNAQLEKADEQKNEFIAVLGHELRNPLAAISGAVEVIKFKPDKLDQMLDLLEKSVRRIAVLLDDMLDLTRISRGKIKLKKKIYDLRETIELAEKEAAHEIKDKDQSLTIDMPEKPLWIDGDHVRMEQVIVNLLTNARKYTNEGGSIELVAKQEGEKVIVTVSDNGIGIPPDKLEEIFEPFTRIKPTIGTPGSLGIGLALVKQIMERHGGEVVAHSKGEGEGATFTVTLPLVIDVTKAEVEEAAEEKPITLPENLKVLIVDDEANVVIGTETFLEEKGCIVRKAESADAAIEAAEDFKPDVFLLDIGMPGMNGYELSRYLRDHGFEDELIIAISGYGHEDAHKMSVEAGMDAHLNKPIDYKVLADTLVKGLHSRKE